MLEKNRTLPAESTEPHLPATVYDWKWMLRTLVQRPLPILVIPAICVALAVAWVLVRPSNYTASALLNITNLRLSSSDQNTFYAESLYDPTFLETQVQIIASEPIARSVIESEGLIEAAGGDEQKALRTFGNRLSVLRVGQSNLAQISYADGDPEKAASVVNAVARAYMDKLRTDRDTAVQTASSWLRERLRGVGAQAQLVSPATPPADKSDMRGVLIIAAAAVAGGVAGLVLSLILGFFDRRVRTPEQVVGATGVECLGIVPLLDGASSSGTARTGQGGAFFAGAPALLSHVVRHPYGPLWQALRHASVVAARSFGSPQRIAVTSTYAGEGKTTIAANLALLAANGGKRVLLVDAQPYNPALTRMLAPDAEGGTMALLGDDAAELSSCLVADEGSGVHFLPLGAAGSNGAQLLWSPRMARLFEQARGYDVIVFDMPPLVAPGDICAASAFLDSVLLVVESNRVPADEMQAALALAAPVREKLAGSVLNKAVLGRIERWFSPEASVIARQSEFAAASGSGDAAGTQ